jgi:hypothetical protein
MADPLLQLHEFNMQTPEFLAVIAVTPQDLGFQRLIIDSGSVELGRWRLPICDACRSVRTSAEPPLQVFRKFARNLE